tara:strand:+ start:7573 stop:8484 length:912 start_codon:yes stop_codon:yes gene_type:complete
MEPKINNALKTLIDTEYLNIILVGNMGSGKTSILNAIIREYYKDIPRSEYQENVLYITNLHEQGINYYRSDVKTFCQTSSVVKRKKKIVVIDDIDMINEQSQQAFRSCIDKYSHNVCFMSSCTNNQKVIESIQSRLTMIKIPAISSNLMKNIADKIVTAENIHIDKKSLDFILSLCNSTIKVLINYLEKCKLLNEEINYEIALKLCSDIDVQTLEEYTKNVKNNNIEKAIKIIYSIVDDGYSVMDILTTYFTFIKITDILTEREKYTIIPYICKYITTFHDVHENDIELPLFTNNLIQILHTL